MEEENLDLVLKTVHALGTTDRYHRAAIETQIDKLGIHRTQHMVLMFLARHQQEEITQKMISDEFEISPAAVAVTIKKLEASDLIKRRQQDGNARANIIELTESGLLMVNNTRIMFHEIDAQMLKDISLDELKQFGELLQRMQNNLKNINL